MPWVHLKRWWEILQKRKRRDLKLQAQLHSLGMASQMGAMWGGGSAADIEEPSESQIDNLSEMGFNVQVRHVGGE
jgi:hypothetical protein